MRLSKFYGSNDVIWEFVCRLLRDFRLLERWVWRFSFSGM